MEENRLKNRGIATPVRTPRNDTYSGRDPTTAIAVLAVYIIYEKTELHV